MAGWFFVMPRVHEAHAFLVLPLLAVAWPRQPRLLLLYAIASLALVTNMVVEDSTFMGTPLPDRANLPLWLLVVMLVNIGLFAALAAGLALALVERRPRAAIDSRRLSMEPGR